MSAPSQPPSSGVDEFEAIARLLRPLAAGAPEALGLADDAAVLSPRPDCDLVISQDALVEGVHFLSDDALDLVARKLLRVNLSDLAAKGAEPYGYLLAAAWPPRCGWPERERFVQGLAADQALFGLKLLGGDTTSTPGPLTLAVTILGWTPQGRMIRRAGARPGDRVLVSGTIGDGWLGLKAAQGALADVSGEEAAWLAGRYRLPEPRVELREPLLEHAVAAADVSDGLIADAGHLGQAGGVAIALELDRLPVSEPAQIWLSGQPDQVQTLVELATGGDDYEVVCACAPDHAAELIAACEACGVAMTDIGEVRAGEGITVLHQGRPVPVARTGWRHG